MKPSASIVIPCYNSAGTLMAQLDQLLPQIAASQAELVLVDNNSTDGTARLIDQVAQREDVVAVQATARQGASHARNVGVSVARSDRLLFCDADDVVSERWVESLVDSLERHSVVTGPLDVTSVNASDVAKSRAGSHAADRPASFYGLFPIAHGGNMAVTRRAWEEVGPLDESLDAIEDMEWSLRATVAGHTVAHAPRATVGYRYRTEAVELWRQGLRYGQHRPIVARMTYERLGIRPSRLSGIRSWAWLACNLGRARTSHGRAQLAWVAGNRIGNLVGSTRARFLVL
ncbi:MAG: glycosyltransferase [Acidimicrobiia bacterium]|nr:glycosyltransferase [Acidimicrobiia bacterium]